MVALLGIGGANLEPVEAVTSNPMLLVFAVSALSLIPFVILLMTSFVKIVVVLSILKSALGTAQIPPSQIIVGLSLILSLFVMAPTGTRMLRAAEPMLGQGEVGEVLSRKGLLVLWRAAEKAREPLREFLVRHGSAKDRAVFLSLALQMRTAEERLAITERDFLVAIPAFISSELRRAFEIGFMVFVPFLVVDLVISNLLVALGMQMLSPTTVSLPFKLLLFLLADGWQLLLRGLVESYV